ncbi:MAG TPA: ATP-binding protein [Ohtaekwangia sp.]|nr:ATP-binding protein [Ohtaekwangia sp.]
MPQSSAETRVLIIDDDYDDFLIISDYLKAIEANRFNIEWCYNYTDAVSQLANRAHHIYFVDYRLGAKTGLDLLRDAEALKCEEPIVLLTGFGNPTIDNEAMRIGAMDYLIKSELTTEKLERCIRYALERAAAIKALRANEQKYRNIFERSKDAVFITDNNLRFKDVNFATSQLLAFDKKDLLGLSLYDLIENKPAKDKIREGLLRDQEVVDLELVLRDKSQEKKYVVLTATGQLDTNGESYIQGILHDITNLKKAERATLYAEKLASAGRLVRTLAHEVRNPLNNVQMAVEQLNTATLSEDDRIFIEIIQRNGKRIDNLIAELLDSYRPTEKTFKVISLQTVLADSVQMASDRITLKSIDIKVNYPSDEPWLIQADEQKLKIAFLNIVVNATEAITNGSGKVEVCLHDHNDAYVVEISDNGCGIPSEILSKLFEPYFTSKRNGMGLGLASTLNIVQAHGGTIDVQSEVNAGSKFIVSIPKIKETVSGEVY